MQGVRSLCDHRKKSSTLRCASCACCCVGRARDAARKKDENRGEGKRGKEDPSPRLSITAPRRLSGRDDGAPTRPDDDGDDDDDDAIASSSHAVGRYAPPRYVHADEWPEACQVLDDKCHKGAGAFSRAPRRARRAAAGPGSSRWSLQRSERVRSRWIGSRRTRVNVRSEPGLAARGDAGSHDTSRHGVGSILATTRSHDDTVSRHVAARRWVHPYDDTVSR